MGSAGINSQCRARPIVPSRIKTWTERREQPVDAGRHRESRPIGVEVSMYREAG